MVWSIGCRTVFAAGLAALVALSPAARAQTPEAAEIATCLCVQRAIDALGAEMTAKHQQHDAISGELAELDARLAGERARIDVNNPQAVAQFRQLLERRDAMFRRSTGPLAADLTAATERYNARVNEFNATCANHPRNADLLARVQASLACPPP